MNQATATYQPDDNGTPVWTGLAEDEPEGPDWGDDDYDGLPNWLEDYYGTDPYNPDSDYDEATDGDEIFLMGTDPLNWDSDSNGYSDFDDLYYSVHGYYPGHEPSSEPEDPDPEESEPQDPPLMITTPEVPSITESAPYSFYFNAQNGVGYLTWSLLSGSLPGNLTLSSDGYLHGDGGSTNEGEYTFVVGVEDEVYSNASHEFTLTVWWPDPGDSGDPDDPEETGDEAYADYDGDGVPNGIEWELGTSADQWDSMNTGVSDWFYWYFSHLGPHATDIDADGDGLGEILENALGTSDESIDTFGNFYGDRFQYYQIVLAPNVLEIDSDGDGLFDLLELTVGMNPNLADTDGDGLSDAHEWEHIAYSSPWQWDTDGDGLHDGIELQIGTEARNVDTDDDHLTDYEEHHQVYGAFAPTKWSTSEDGVPDFFKADLTDTDGGGIPDRLEIYWGLNPHNAADEHGDIDSDHVSNLDEYMTGYDIWGGWRDTLDWDADGMTNAYELFFGLDPNDPSDGADDPDGDFLTNSEESTFYTNPWLTFTFIDFAAEGWHPSIPAMDENGNPLVDENYNQVYRHPANDYETVFGVEFAIGTAHLTRDNGPTPGREYEDDWDGDGLSNYQEIYETETNPREFDNEPPGELEMTPSGGYLGSVEPGGSVSVEFSVTGGDGNYYWSASGPSWLSMDPYTGTLSGQVPPEESPSSVLVDVTLSDGSGQTATGQFEIFVQSDPVGSCECMGASCHCSMAGQCYETCSAGGGGGSGGGGSAQPQPDTTTGCPCPDEGCGCTDTAPACGGIGGCVENPPPEGCTCGGGICDTICGDSPAINGQNPCGINGSCDDNHTECSCGCELDSCSKDSEAEAPPCQCWCTCGCNEDPSSPQKCGARGPDNKCQSGSGQAPYPCGAPTPINLKIWNSQDAANEVADKTGVGAFTVANLNDTDGDGIIDKDDDDVPGEKDLMKLYVGGYAGLTGQVKLTVKSGSVKFWEHKEKKNQPIALNANGEVFFTIPAGGMNKTIWVEATAASGAVRDIEIWEGYQPAQGALQDGTDKVKATAIWVDPGANPIITAGNAVPGNLDDATAKGTFQNLHDSKFGIFNASPGKSQFSYSIGLEFKVKPAGIGNEPGIKFDVSRQKETAFWIKDQVGWFSDPLKTTAFPAQADEPNDDNGRADEDNDPTNDHIYSLDNPFVPILQPQPPVIPERVVKRANFKEFVRIRFDGQAFQNQNGTVEGSRCSNFQNWRMRGDIGNSSGAWNLSPGGSNELQGGHVPLGAHP